MYTCNFEEHECDWINSYFEDGGDWTVGQVIDVPYAEYKEENKYLYLNADRLHNAKLLLPWQLILPNGVEDMGALCFNFHFSVYAAVLVLKDQLNPSQGHRYKRPIVMWKKHGSRNVRPRSWNRAQVTVHAKSSNSLMFKGIKILEDGFVALDNFYFTKGHCLNNQQ